MLHKLIRIENVGRFRHLCAPFPEWDGRFRKNNILFGENRLGKTTIALILRSLAGSDDIILKKRSFHATNEPKVELLADGNKMVKYQDGHWSEHDERIRVFDIHYIEDNLYAGYVATEENQENLFEVILGEHGVELKNEIRNLTRTRRQISRERTKIKNIIRALKREGKTDALEKLDGERAKYNQMLKPIDTRKRDLNIALGLYSKAVFEQQSDRINDYLSVFAPGIQIKKFSKKNPRHNVSLSLVVEDQIVRFHDKSADYSARYVLSEGDRNALAFSFFLAQLDFETDLANLAIVFDDPISSFDHFRKTLTVGHLRRLSSKVKQLFVFSHDILFARECSERFEKANTLQLKLVLRQKEVVIEGTNLATETLTGVFRDLHRIEQYLTHGVSPDAELADIARCIRPILEGVIRFKYFRVVLQNEWLGDIISRVRTSKPADELHALTPMLGDLEDLNDYSKGLHHADPTVLSSPVSQSELDGFLTRLVTTIKRV